MGYIQGNYRVLVVVRACNVKYCNGKQDTYGGTYRVYSTCRDTLRITSECIPCTVLTESLWLAGCFMK